MNKLFYKKVRKMILAAVALMTVLAMVACGNESVSNDNIVVETQYAVLQYPAEFDGRLTAREVVQDSVSMVIFSAPMGEQEWELFRLYFNDEAVGVQSGYIVQGADEISVSYDVCLYEDEDFPGEDVKDQYYQNMEVFNHVMASIYDHPQYAREKYVAPVNSKDCRMKYWEVTIPENVQWQEETIGGLYRVDFYGEMYDEKVPLYSIGLGEMEADYTVGTFEIESGELVPVCVKIYDLYGGDHWTDEDYNTAYRMMESVNDVIQEIMSSNRYSESDAA